MIDVTTWTAPATREPSPDLLWRLDARWRDCAALGDPDCVWESSPVHSLALVHADRGTHRRRLRTQYFGEGTCHRADEGHGFTPMSDLIPHDRYGPELLDVVHTGNASPLAAALKAAKADPNLAAITVFTEDQFSEVDTYLDHAATSLQPEAHGAVIPFLKAPIAESVEDAVECEDLMRANGFTSYTVDTTAYATDPIGLHQDVASVVEDMLDEIAQIKADAAAGILTRDPMWPLAILRGTPL